MKCETEEETKQEGHPYDWLSHNYADIYELLFRCRRKDVKLLIECGLGTNNPKILSTMGIDGKPGASHRMWRDFFPNAQIIGIDIDKNILFKEERINTFYCNQLDKESIKEFAKQAKIEEKEVDIIIDDGLHTFEAGKNFFEGVIKYLSDDGIYVIEDVLPNDIFLYKKYFINLSKDFTAHFINLKRSFKDQIGDNRLILINKNS